MISRYEPKIDLLKSLKGGLLPMIHISGTAFGWMFQSTNSVFAVSSGAKAQVKAQGLSLMIRLAPPRPQGQLHAAHAAHLQMGSSAVPKLKNVTVVIIIYINAIVNIYMYIYIYYRLFHA